MNEYGQRSDNKENNGNEQSALSRLTRILGIASSLILIGLVAWWAFHIGSRDASEVPVIAALEGETRTKPEDPGGTIVEHQGLEVNSVLEGEEPALADAVELAPADDVNLDDVDPAAIDEENTEVAEADNAELIDDDGATERPLAGVQVAKPVSRPSLLYILPKDQLHPSTLEAQPIGGDKPVTDGLEISNAAVEVIAAAPVALPEIDNEVEQPAADVVVEEPPVDEATAIAEPSSELGPRLTSGTPLIQLAANPDLNATQQQWQEIQKGNNDILGDKSLYVETTEVNGTTFYRLRVQGFADGAASQAACTALLARNIDCLVVKAN